MLQLYKSLVRPHLDYNNCIQVWRPYLKKDKDAIEKVLDAIESSVEQQERFWNVED